MLTSATDNMIEELIDATYGDPADVRQRHVLAHALHGLVRLAKSEQLLAMRLDVERATASAGQRRLVAAPQHPHQTGGHHGGCAVD